MADIYGKYRASMERVMDGLVRQIEANGMSDTGENATNICDVSMQTLRRIIREL